MEPIPTEWIDRIFEILADMFKNRWTDGQEKPERLQLLKTMWKNGLIGLDKDDIRKGLRICKDIAKNDLSPPNVLEFFHYSKGYRFPYIPPKSSTHTRNIELATQHIKQIKAHLKTHNHKVEGQYASMENSSSQ